MNAVEFGQGQVPLGIIFAYISEPSFSLSFQFFHHRSESSPDTTVPISVLVVFAALFLALHSKARRLLMLLLRMTGAYIALVLPRTTLDGTLHALEEKLERLRARRRG